MNKLEVLKSLNVLYVEDDLEEHKIFLEILKFYFNNIYSATNGEEALKIYKKYKIDLLITDYDMPILNGYELIKEIKKINKKLLSIIISSYDDKEKLLNVINLNLIDYIIKPYKREQIINTFIKVSELIEEEGFLKIHLYKDCYYDFNKKVIYKDSNCIKLTSYEIKIIEKLLLHKNQIVSYESLLYDLETSDTKSLISMVYKINKKSSSKLVRNIKDFGYKIEIL